MDRADALTYLGESFSAIATELGVTATDTAAGYKSVLDYALRLVGVAEGDLAAADITSDVPDYLIALDYAALLRFQRMAAIRVDIEVGDPSVRKSRSQLFKAISALLADAKAAAEQCGVLTGTSSWELGRLNLDHLEVALADLA